jgi:hypothetical protein
VYLWRVASGALEKADMRAMGVEGPVTVCRWLRVHEGGGSSSAGAGAVGAGNGGGGCAGGGKRRVRKMMVVATLDKYLKAFL